MRSFALALCTMMACACSASAEPEAEADVLRVAAGHELDEFVPSASPSGSGAYALELVYEDIVRHAEIIDRQGRRVRLHRKDSSPHAAASLAESLAFEGLLATAAEGEEIVATFESPEAAAGFLESRTGGFATGPYRVQAASSERIVLEARSDASVSRIVIVPVPAGEQWRRLMGRDVDVVPMSPMRVRDQFEGMDSIRIVDFPTTGQLGLFINPSVEGLDDAAVRRRLLSSLDHEAVAHEACGVADCAGLRRWFAPPASDIADTASVVESFESAPDLVDSPALELLVLRSDSGARVAAAVLRHQLHRLGLRVEIRPVPIEQFHDRMRSADYELSLQPMYRQPARAYELFAAYPDLWGWERPDLVGAVERGDLDEARRILQTEALVLPLYETRSFAAIDASWCGADPHSATSWRWLADLYPCDEEEPD